MFDFLQICLRKAKPVCKIPHMFILADVWLLPNMFGKNQTRWYIYTWVLFSTHVWILTHRYGKRHTCVQKATQLYVCKCLAFSTHVWEKPLTCLFPPELWVYRDDIQGSTTTSSERTASLCTLVTGTQFSTITPASPHGFGTIGRIRRASLSVFLRSRPCS